jgi:hypothetical protein
MTIKRTRKLIQPRTGLLTDYEVEEVTKATGVDAGWITLDPRRLASPL